MFRHGQVGIASRLLNSELGALRVVSRLVAEQVCRPNARYHETQKVPRALMKAS